MAHIAHRPTPARRLFSYSDAEMARRDQEQDDRLQARIDRMSERICRLCHGSGHNCPECSGWDDEYEQESD